MKRLISSLAVSVVCWSLLAVTGAAAQTKADTNNALKMLEKWKKTHGKPILDEEGRLLYVFGESMPQVVCAPLALCDIRMQPGEEIVSVRIGDKTRWLVNNARSGSDEQAAEHLIVKPTTAGLATTLFVGTNRRAYVIELISHATDFMSKVGFLYNDTVTGAHVGNTSSDGFAAEPRTVADVSQYSDIRLAPRAPAPEPLPDIVITAPQETIEEHEVLAHNLNFGYRVFGPNVVWKPIRVYDDGVKTFIDMNPRKVGARELPVFLNNDTDKRGHMINYRYIPHDARFIVDGLFDRGSLVLGTGRKRVRVQIVREHLLRASDSTPRGG